MATVVEVGANAALVYVVTAGDYDDHHVVAVFCEEHDARAFVVGYNASVLPHQQAEVESFPLLHMTGGHDAKRRQLLS